MVIELCSICNFEVELEDRFELQKCPLCKEDILPCAQCINMNCVDCPLL